MSDLMSYLVENAKRVNAGNLIQTYLICNASVQLLKAVIPDIEQQFYDNMTKQIREGILAMQEKE